MKLMIGVITLLFVLTGAILTILALWGVQPISWTIVWKSGITILIIGATTLIASILYIFFIKKDPFKKSRND